MLCTSFTVQVMKSFNSLIQFHTKNWWLKKKKLHSNITTVPMELEEHLYCSSNGKISNEVAFGETFCLTCKASGLPPPRYQWFHGNLEMPNETSSILSLFISRWFWISVIYYVVTFITLNDTIYRITVPIRRVNINAEWDNTIVTKKLLSVKNFQDVLHLR